MKSLVCLTSIVVLFGGVLYAANGVMPGAGSPQSPFIIEDLADFNTFAGTSSYWTQDVYTKLGTDLDLSTESYQKAVIAWATSTGTSFSGTKYNGIFDGDNHTIENMTIHGESARFVGLFGYIGQYGEVLNLTLSDCNVAGNRYSGGLCGQSQGFIYNCDVSGQVIAGYYTGGLCGYNYYEAVISECSADCHIEGVSCVGVLCGSNASATIMMSKSSGDVFASYGTAYVGGLCGANGNTEDSYILNSCSFAEVVTEGDYSGGLCGWNYAGTIAGCYSAGNVAGYDYVGGLAGYNDYGTITSSYSLGDVEAGYTTGGFCGENTGYIINVYSAGDVTIDDDYYAGGLCGYNDGDIEGAFWDTSACSLSWSDGGQGYDTGSLQQSAIFINAGWDFTNESANGTSDVWRMPFETGYPILAWQKDIVGDLTGQYGVNMEDLAEVGLGWQTSAKCGDVDGSGYVDMTDIILLAQNWLCGIE